MPELPKPLPADGGENGEGSGADNGGAKPEGGGDNKPEGGEGGGEGGEGGDKKPDGSDKGSQGKDDEPPVKQRKSVKDFIIERQQKKIAKLQNKGGEGSEGGEGGEDDDEISPEDEKVITKVLDKKLTPILDPILKKSLQAEDEAEITDFLKDNPDFRPYEAKARQWMQHPSRRNLPISSIFYEIAGPDLMKIGAKRAKDADDESKRAGAGGGSAKGNEGGASVWDLPKDDFSKKQEELRRSR